MAEIYEPAEDSYLMSEALISEIPKLLKQNPDLRFLEIGAGSGINLKTAEKAGIKIKNIWGADINVNAINQCSNLGFNIVKSDLFKNINGRFDLVVFNPPYLPLDKKEPKDSRISTTGGKRGNEVIIRFLKQAKEHLNDNGKIFIITSSLSSDINFRKLGYSAKVIADKKIFFEKLFLWELS